MPTARSGDLRAIEYQQLLSSLPTPDFEPFAEKILEWIPDQDLVTPPTEIELVLADYRDLDKKTTRKQPQTQPWQ